MARVVHNTHANPSRNAERETQKLKALELWMSGNSYADIATTLKVSQATAWRRVQAAIDDMRPHLDWERHRAIQLAELEISRRLLRRVIVEWRHGVDQLDDACKAVTQLLKIQEREAKLLGLDKVATPVDELTGMSNEQLEAIVADFKLELELETEPVPA